MDRTLLDLLQSLQKLIGYHRELMEAVRNEHQSLVDMDLKGVQESTFSKEALISSIHTEEQNRLARIGELAVHLKRPAKELTLQEIIIVVQGIDLPLADKFRSAMNALNILIDRIKKQNQTNERLVEASLGHIRNMKRNVLGEGQPQSETYGQTGQRVSPGTSSSRLLSKEA